MKFSSSVILASILGLILSSPGQAGQLDADLAASIRQAPQDSLISVWIEVESSLDSKSLKRSVEAQSATRAEQHAVAFTELKQRAHEQDNLLTELQQLKDRGRADRIKGHWIVNVVEADVTAGELAALASRNDIANIYLKPIVALIEPSSSDSPELAPEGPDSVGSNLTHVRAREAWGLGYTGTGRLVCSFDTGVNGLHPALYSRWKGLDGDSAAAWFDPVDQLKFPHYFTGYGSTTASHGTHTMGIMVGADTAVADTVGVAPGAKWISAAVIDIYGASILDAFEWASDPDGNPNTVSDVPDVINHSWGFKYISCLNVFYDAIDNTEALGIVNIFAAGNSGSPGPSIQSPADRALDSLDCFAVGNIDVSIDQISSTSSRGPSPCNLTAIKPNVVAPGTNILSCGFNYTVARYISMSGTSMAAPHVSGLVALLRQKNPNATVDQIKTAILTSTRRPFAWGFFPNNNYGWGEIDCVQALALLPTANPTPHLRLYDFDHAPILPGDTVSGAVLLQNLGAAANAVTAVVLGTNSALTILDGTLTFGDIGTGVIKRSLDSIRVVVADTVTDGSAPGADFVVHRGAVSDTMRLFFLVGDMPAKSSATHIGTRIKFTLTDYGAYGLATGSLYPLHGVGFTFDALSNDLYEGGLMVGTSYSKVSSGVHSYLFEPDMDFEVAPSGTIRLSVPGTDAAQQTWAMFNDSTARKPIGVLITQESFMYDPPNDDFLIMRYILKNISGGSLSNLHVGLFMDWDIPPYYDGNAGGYETNGAFVWQAYNSGTVLSRFRGVKLLKGTLSAAGVIGFDTYLHWPPITITPAGDGYSTDEKFSSMTSMFLYADSNKTARTDCFSIVGAGPMNMAANQIDTVTFALLAGAVLDDLRNAAFRADSIVTDVNETGEETLLPDDFVLYQNYPNPFNPSTSITFDLPTRSHYRLEIFNVLGQTLYERDEEARAGRVAITWSGDGYASGAYFYRLTVEGRSVTRKMMLLK